MRHRNPALGGKPFGHRASRLIRLRCRAARRDVPAWRAPAHPDSPVNTLSSLFALLLSVFLLIAGNSMQPTLHPGSIAGVNKLAYRFGPPRRGDVVAIRAGRELIVKRILGLPGE